MECEDSLNDYESYMRHDDHGAEEDSLIATIEAQAKEIEQLNKALYDVAFVARTKISMKQMARKALGIE